MKNKPEEFELKETKMTEEEKEKFRKNEDTDLFGYEVKKVPSCPYCEKNGQLRLVWVIGKQTGLLHRIFMSVAHQKANEDTGLHFCGNQYLNIYQAVKICPTLNNEIKKIKPEAIETRIKFMMKFGGRMKDMQLLLHAMDKIRDGFPLESVHDEIINKTCDLNIGYRIHGKIRKNNFELLSGQSDSG
jgi:hypothetical protein